MIRADMISTVGRAYLTSNIENDEYSYPKAFAVASLTFAPIQNSAGRKFEKLDIRFVKDNISVLIETKQMRNSYLHTLNTKRRSPAIKLLQYLLIRQMIMSGCGVALYLTVI